MYSTLYKSMDSNKFIPVIESCMKMYKNTLNSKVQSLILDFLGRIVACGVNFSRLDKDNTFLGFIVEQACFIIIPYNTINTHIIIQNIFLSTIPLLKFLVYLGSHF